MSETITIYRFRIWQDQNENYKYDDDIYTQDIPAEIVEQFHQPGQVYSIFAETSDEMEIEAKGKVLLVLSDDKEKISQFVSGISFTLSLDRMFDQ